MANFTGAGADDFITHPGVENNIPIPEFSEPYWDYNDLIHETSYISYEGLAASSNLYDDRGPLTNNYIYPPNHTYQGAVAHTFSEDFYNRLHIHPNPVDFGIVTEELTLPLTIWNACFEPSTMTDYILQNSTGISLEAGAVTPPNVVIPALYSHSIDITVETVGPSVINGLLGFTFETTTFAKPVVVTDIVGRRAKLFPFSTSWQEDPIEKLEWKTNILETDNWKERRFKLRQWPRRYFQIGMGAIGPGASDLRAALLAAQAEIYSLPLWMYEAKLTVAAQPGDYRIYLDTTYNNFQDDSSVMLFSHPGRFESLDIVGVTDTYIDISSERAVSEIWGVGTPVYPIRKSRMDNNISIKAESGNALTATVNFQTVEQEKTFSGQHFNTYLGYPYVHIVPNWASGRQLSFQRKVDNIDLGIYPKEYFKQSERYGERQEFEWFLNGRKAIAEFKDLMQYMAGRHQPVWIPSWHEDFTFVGDYQAGATVLKVKGNFASKMHQANVTEPIHVRMRLKNGKQFVVRMNSAQSDPDSPADDIMIIAYGWEESFTNNWIDNFSILTLVRLAADSVEIVWKTSEMAISKTTFVYVPDQP